MKKWFNNSLLEISHIHRVHFHSGQPCMVCYHYRALNVAFHLSYRFQNNFPSYPIQTNFLQLMKLNLFVITLVFLKHINFFFKYLHSQGPVSVEVPEQGLLPLKSICRCLISALQVPAHAPQLSQVVQSPSSDIWDWKVLFCSFILYTYIHRVQCQLKSQCRACYH